MDKSLFNVSSSPYTPELCKLLKSLKSHENLNNMVILKHKDTIIYVEEATHYPLSYFFEAPGALAALTSEGIDKLFEGIVDGVDWLHDLGLYCGNLTTESILVTPDFTPLITNYCREVTDIEAAQKDDLAAREVILDQLRMVEEIMRPDSQCTNFSNDDLAEEFDFGFGAEVHEVQEVIHCGSYHGAEKDIRLIDY